MSKFKRLFIIIFILLFAFSLYGCKKDGDENGTKNSPTIALENTNYTLEIGEELVLTPVLTNLDAYELEYSLSKDGILSSTEAGKFTALASGKVTVTVKVKGLNISASAEVTVKESLVGTITFHTNGGSSVATLSGMEGETIDYSNSITTYEGHEFIKWVTAYGEEAPKVFSRGNTNLYAFWYGEILNNTMFFGHYPQDRVKDENLVSKIKVNSNKNGTYGGITGQDIYVYGGKKYIFVKTPVDRNNNIYGDINFFDGTRKLFGKEYCIELAPIEWKVSNLGNKKYKITAKKVLDNSLMGMYDDLSSVDPKYFEKFENTFLYHMFSSTFSDPAVFTAEDKKLLASDFSLPKKSDYFSGLVTDLDGIIKEATDYACLRGLTQNKWAIDISSGDSLSYPIYDYWFSDCKEGQTLSNLEYYYRTGSRKAANCYNDSQKINFEEGVVPQYIIDMRETNTYSVSFFDQDKETIASNALTVSAKEGDKAYFTTPKLSDLSLNIPEDYMFKGFKNFDESDSTLYLANTRYEIKSNNLKLYAVYEEDTRLVTSNISYILNGGSTNGGNPDTIQSSDVINLYDATHESRYKRFVGWFTENEGGNKVVTLSKVRHNLTLYARWEDIDASEIDFAYNELEDGTYEVYAINNFKYTDLVLPSKYKGKDVTKVKSEGFKNKNTITSITIPSTIKVIGSSAFSYLNSLNELTIPSTVEKVENRAFEYSTIDKLYLSKTEYDNSFYYANISDIEFSEDFDEIFRIMFNGTTISDLVLPNSIKKIDEMAFVNSRITNLTLSENLETIAAYAFQYSHITTLNYLTKNASFDIGTYTNVYADTVFINANVKNIIVGENVESFMEGFDLPECDTLDIKLDLNDFLKINKSVSFLEGAKELKFNSDSLTGDIVIDDEVTILPSNLFRNTTITSLYIPDGILYYGTNILNGCSSLTELNVPKTSFKKSPNNSSDESLIYLFGTLQFTGSSQYNKAGFMGYYPNTLEKITARGAGARSYNESFDFNSLKEVYLPEGGFYPTTGNYYTIRNTNLEKLYIGKAANKILANSVFTNLKNLKELTLPTLDRSLKDLFSYAVNDYSLENITILGGTQIVDYAFDSFVSLKEINIPDTITAIGNYAYANIPITEITIGSNVASIGNFAFQNTKLTSLTIPKSVTSIGKAILKDSYDMTTLNLESGNKKFYAYGTNTIVEVVDSKIRVACTIPTSTWPNTVDVVSAYSYWFLNADEFDAPEPSQDDKTVTYEAYAFSGAKIKTMLIGSKTVLVQNSLSNIDGLENLELNSLQVSIADLFGNKSNIPESLTGLSFGDGITSIPDYAFQGMNNLTNLNGLDFSKITSIGTYAFDGCSNYASDLILPECLTVGKYAFKGMKNIAIYLPKCTTLGDYAFEGTNGLTYIDISSASNRFYEVFYNAKNIGIIHLGKDFKGRLFNSVTSVEGIIIDDGLTSLPANSLHTAGTVRGTIGWIVLPGSVTTHDLQAICHYYNGKTYGANITTIYYKGTQSQKTTFMNNSKLINDNTANNDTSYTALNAATWYMYSETNASGCWHYNEDTGLPELY